MRKSDIFVIAAWAATIVGLVEGTILIICRAYPSILAPYKVSPHVLWVAPTVDLPLFLLAAVGFDLLRMVTRKRLGGFELLLAYGFFTFLGIFTLTTAPKIIHRISAAVLSLGLTVVICRKLRGYEPRLTCYLRGRVVWIPVLIVTAGIGALVYEHGREMWLSHQLYPAPAEAANVIVIVMDTVRYDSFTRPTEKSLTPSLDRIVANGVGFENAWATSSWSLPSHASILTGRYPHEHGADWPDFQLNNGYPTISEFFRERGYVTGAFSGNASWVTPEYLGRGFLRFDVYMLEDLLRRTVHGRKVGRLLWEVGYHYGGRGKKAPRLHAQFLKFLNDYSDRPFFVLLNYMDVNQAFHNRRLNRAFWERQASISEVVQGYHEGVRMLDEQIGYLFAQLEQRGILEKTLVIITSDHGESFGTEGADDHEPLGHGSSLYPEQIRVPLFVIYPGKVPAGRKITSHVSLRQIPATITHLLDHGETPFVGQPLPIALDAGRVLQNNNPPLLATLNYGPHRLRAVIWDHWLYIYNRNEPQGREQLYDLSADPLAITNLATGHATISLMRQMMHELLASGSQLSPAISQPSRLQDHQAARLTQ